MKLMNDYQKIQTLFKRDANSIIIPTEYTLDEFKYLENNLWECTEKLDGCNQHIDLIPVYNNTETEVVDIQLEFHGRTSKAVIPPHLLEKLKSIFDKDTLIEYFFKDKEYCPISIYGEGYGVKIQNGGNYIKDGVDFRLFDIKINNWWLSRSSIEQIAKDLNLNIVPLIGYMTIPEAIEYVKKGFKSIIAENKDYDAEGLVLKTPNGLLLRNGERLITKIKTCDFRKFAAKYGENYTGEQPKNEHY
jgi:hypothetical protein